MAEFELEGMSAILAKFEGMKQEVKYKGGRAALRKAAKFLEGKARSGAQQIDNPLTAEVIAKNVSARWNGRLFKSTGDLGFRVGVLGGAKQYANTKENVRAGRVGGSYATGGDKGNPGGDTWYWRLVEFGSENNAAHPFLRPAIQNNQQEAIGVFAKALDKSIDAAIRKANKAAK